MLLMFNKMSNRKTFPKAEYVPQPLLLRESGACIVQDQIERDFTVRPHMVDKGHKLTFDSLGTCMWLRPSKTCAFVKVWAAQGPGSEKLRARRR